MIETRPDIHDLERGQRQLALAHWHTFLLLEGAAGNAPPLAAGAKTFLKLLESFMEVLTLRRLAQARDRYFREKASASIDMAQPSGILASERRPKAKGQHG